MAINDDKYNLVVRNDRSDNTWLFANPSSDAVNAAASLVSWCTVFGPSKSFMSDEPTHFKNETIRLLAKSLSIKHHFTRPYSPWSNGAVERLGKKLLWVSRAVTSELQLRSNEWPDLLPPAQNALNHSQLPQRRN